ncbi:hypothetical protein UAJ10_02350 [Nitrospirillum sp. BR 11164]|uniref:hypothetical protein n=1 Tax=Nitrospirillum sp. BR 11164 TaxID=3104324 RepID=UPI002B001214|nr:hypothetical protein [Nitrospirillum sp. BR 11164]MEA1647857.1 hypothetical protein [Nitrospirillum sp. BR 11164]
MRVIVRVAKAVAQVSVLAVIVLIPLSNHQLGTIDRKDPGLCQLHGDQYRIVEIKKTPVCLSMEEARQVDLMSSSTLYALMIFIASFMIWVAPDQLRKLRGGG